MAFPGFFFGGGEIDTGLAYYRSSARIYHKFSGLSGNHNDTASLSVDLSPNGRNLTNNPGNLYTTGYPSAPKVFSYKYPSLVPQKRLSVLANNPMMFFNNVAGVPTALTNAVFATSHEIDIKITTKSAGFLAPLFGINSTEILYAQIETDGKISFFIKRGASTTRIRTLAAVATQAIQNCDSANQLLLTFIANFTVGSEAAKILLGGVELATELVSGLAPASWNSAYVWNNLYSFAVGGLATAVNTTGNSKVFWIDEFAVTPLRTQDQRNACLRSMIGFTSQSSKLKIIGDYQYLPLCTASKRFYQSFFIGQLPPSDCTVTITSPDPNVTISAPLTFTPANYNVPQYIHVTAVANKGYTPVTLNIAMTGGFTANIVKTIYVTESRTGAGTENDLGTDWFLTDGYCVSRQNAAEVSITDPAAFRTAIQTYIFKGNYPAGEPVSSLVPTGYGAVTLANANAGDKVQWLYTEPDEIGHVFTNLDTRVKNISPTRNNRLLVQLSGHGEPGHQATYDAVMAAKFDWLGTSLPIKNVNTVNPLTGITIGIGHYFYQDGVDTATLDARRFWLFDAIRALDKARSENAYDKLVGIGISGGAYKQLMLAAVYPYFDMICLDRGVMDDCHPFSNADYEQGSSRYTSKTGGAPPSTTVPGPRVVNFQEEYTYMELFALVMSTGCKIYHLSHKDDAIGGQFYIEMYKDKLESIAASYGTTYEQRVNINPAEATHGLQPDDIAWMITRLSA